MSKILVAGAGGAIGGHLAKSFIDDGHEVLCADIKPLSEWWQVHEKGLNTRADLSHSDACKAACYGVDEVYMLAASMGGIGYIETHKVECMLNVLISTNMLKAAHEAGVKKYFFSSSACAYKQDLQSDTDVTALKESDAYPADPEDAYGWEKLFTERMCRHFYEDYGLETRVARFHNVYGPKGSWTGGREKAPAAISRKIIEAGPNGTISIWGDGEQTRSFMFIGDCVRGIKEITNGNFRDPVNLGSAELVSISDLVSIIEDIAGYKVNRVHDLTKPLGVRGRNSDNTLFRSLYGWEPSIPLREGLEKTFGWIYNEMRD